MAKDLEVKVCHVCQEKFVRKAGENRPRWNNRVTCTMKCLQDARKEAKSVSAEA